MTYISVTQHSRILEAERLGRSLLPDMTFEDRLKVAEVALSNYGRVAATYPVDYEQIRTDIARELRELSKTGEKWAARALFVYCCKVCLDRLADQYSPQVHRMMCGVISTHRPAGDVVFHRATRIQYRGGSWSLNVYTAQCGATNLVSGSRGSVPCRTCFQ